jgi:trehalose-phosphatase
MTPDYKKIKRALEKNNRRVLFLDYDGTLADFTKHPDSLAPDPEVVKLLKALSECEAVTPAIISGRGLAQLQELVPISGMTLAGTYGLEIQLPDEELFYPLKYEAIRPALEELKPVWQGLIEGKGPFYLEDKGWALAIHARFVDEGIANAILLDAQMIARRKLDPADFQVNAGHKFLEASPNQADKGKCVEFLLQKISRENVVILYLGDDDKDENAFEVVQSYGGFAIRVCSNVIHNPIEDWRLEDPQTARDWLWTLIT